MTTEHKRLASACEALFEALSPDFAGDMPDALLRMAEAINKAGMDIDAWYLRAAAEDQL